MKVGDYVRTDKGLIGKVIIKEEYATHTLLQYKGQYCKRVLSTTGTDSEVIKSSPNIIDLIEVGDYVNGLKVYGVNREIKGFGTIIFSKDSSIMEDYIYSIITHEQFESMEYKVGE